MLQRRYMPFVLPVLYVGAIGVTWLVLESRTEGYRPKTERDVIVDSLPLEEPFDDYVSSATCRSCHPGEYHSWHGSYHSSMTQLATPETVKAPFDGQYFEVEGHDVFLERRGEEFWVNIFSPEASGKPREQHERRIAMVSGSHRAQVYWLDEHYTEKEPADDRSLWLFPFGYLLDEQQWVPRFASQISPQNDGVTFDKEAEWNTNCIMCHTTHGAWQSELRNDKYTTRAAEFGISCESCHGPGEEHIAANRDPLRRYKYYDEGEGQWGDPTIVNPAKINHERSTQVCAQCHAVMGGFKTHLEKFMLHGNPYRPGEDLHKSMDRTRMDDFYTNERLQHRDTDPSEILKNYFWKDGMIRVTGREYNGLMETPCFTDGEMSCLSCHTMHKRADDDRPMKEWARNQLAPGMETNRACTQCHESYEEPQELAAHTHHSPASSGSNCYNCHMPHTTYGLLKAIRSHQVDSPDVAVTVETGRPNACNQCHLDKSLGWTADHLADWYDISRPALEPDYEEIAASVIWALKGDAGQRALMAWNFGWDEARETSGDRWFPAYLAELIDDPYHGVRVIARKSLRKYPGYEEIPAYPFPEGTKEDVLSIWKSQMPMTEERVDLLLDAENRYFEETFARLLSERDHTVISLNE